MLGDVACVVLDTNVLVGSAYAPSSASRRLVDACLAGKLQLMLSPALLREYDFVLARAVRRPGFEDIWRRLRDSALMVEPAEVPRIVPDDPDDDKLVAVARAAGCDLVTNDRHLLKLDGGHDGMRILRPAEFAAFAKLC